MKNEILPKKGDFLALLDADDIKPTKAACRVDELLPQLTRDELKELLHRMTFDELADPNTDSETRREILSTMEVCPCCQHWLGHNRPPY